MRGKEEIREGGVRLRGERESDRLAGKGRRKKWTGKRREAV